jgi:hypothetical protein
MATGDRTDILARLKGAMPLWFGQSSPILDGVLSGFSVVAEWGYGLLQYAKLQTRVATATEGFLDLAAFDFLGRRIRRKPAQSDTVLRGVIQKEVLRTRATRTGVLQAIQDLTNSQATMFEPAYSFDTGGLDTTYLAYDEVGAWGSRDYPFQAFLNIQQPVGVGVPNVAGLDTSYGAFDGGGYSSLVDATAITGVVTNQDIYDTIEATRAAGVTMWVNIGSPPITGGHLDTDFYLDATLLA